MSENSKAVGSGVQVDSASFLSLWAIVGFLVQCSAGGAEKMAVCPFFLLPNVDCAMSEF